jgi:hypothetical protein
MSREHGSQESSSPKWQMLRAVCYLAGGQEMAPTPNPPPLPQGRDEKGAIGVISSTAHKGQLRPRLEGVYPRECATDGQLVNRLGAFVRDDAFEVECVSNW